MNLSLNDLECLMGLLGSRPCQAQETDLFKRLKKAKEEMVSFSTKELDDLISSICSLPYRPLPPSTTALLERFKAIRATRSESKDESKDETSKRKINFYVIAKVIQKVQTYFMPADGSAQGAIILMAHGISNALAENDDQFNEELFLHTCGVEA